MPQPRIELGAQPPQGCMLIHYTIEATKIIACEKFLSVKEVSISCF